MTELSERDYPDNHQLSIEWARYGTVFAETQLTADLFACESRFRLDPSIPTPFRTI
jgi:hypothetical protein